MMSLKSVVVFFFVLAIVLVLISLICINVFIVNGKVDQKLGKVCQKTVCIQESARLLSQIDFTADPCLNFQKHVCGSYILSDKHNNIKNEQFYNACVYSVSAKDSDFTILSIISEIGGWPLLLGQKWSDKEFHWLKYMVKLRSRGLRNDWFLDFDYFLDDNYTNLLLILPPEVKTISSTFRKIYLHYMVSVAVKFGSSEKFAWEVLTNVVNFEQELMNISSTGRSKLSKIVKISVEKLNIVWPEVRLVEIFNGLARNLTIFTNSTFVAVAQENYLDELNLLLRRTPRRTQANYIIWKIIESYLPFSSEDFFFGSCTRENFCIEATNRRFYQTTQLYNNNRNVKQIINLINKQHFEVVIKKFQYNAKTENNLFKMINELQLFNEDEFYGCINNQTVICFNKEIQFDIEKNVMYIPSDYINYEKFRQDIIWKIPRKKIFLHKNNLNSIIDLVYLFYKESINSQAAEESLPALNYTPLQLFWIEAASVDCQQKNSTKFNEIVNSKYFKQDFYCP